MLETTKRRQGRPPLPPGERQIQVSITMPVDVASELLIRADELGVSRSELVRRAALIVLGRAGDE